MGCVPDTARCSGGSHNVLNEKERQIMIRKEQEFERRRESREIKNQKEEDSLISATEMRTPKYNDEKQDHTVLNPSYKGESLQILKNSIDDLSKYQTEKRRLFTEKAYDEVEPPQKRNPQEQEQSNSNLLLVEQANSTSNNNLEIDNPSKKSSTGRLSSSDVITVDPNAQKFLLDKHDSTARKSRNIHDLSVYKKDPFAKRSSIIKSTNRISSSTTINNNNMKQEDKTNENTNPLSFTPEMIEMMRIGHEAVLKAEAEAKEMRVNQEENTSGQTVNQHEKNEIVEEGNTSKEDDKSVSVEDVDEEAEVKEKSLETSHEEAEKTENTDNEEINETTDTAISPPSSPLPPPPPLKYIDEEDNTKGENITLEKETERKNDGGEENDEFEEEITEHIKKMERELSKEADMIDATTTTENSIENSEESKYIAQNPQARLSRNIHDLDHYMTGAHNFRRTSLRNTPSSKQDENY